MILMSGSVPDFLTNTLPLSLNLLSASFIAATKAGSSKEKFLFILTFNKVWGRGVKRVENLFSDSTITAKTCNAAIRPSPVVE